MGRHKLSDERLLGTEVPLDFSTYMQFTDFPIYTFYKMGFGFTTFPFRRNRMGAYFCKKAQAYSGLPAYAGPIPD